jgi:hypothetical protein
MHLTIRSRIKTFLQTGFHQIPSEFVFFHFVPEQQQNVLVGAQKGYHGNPLPNCLDPCSINKEVYCKF